MNKIQLLKLYNLYAEIERIEKSLINKDYTEWFGMIYLETLRNFFDEVYIEFDNEEISYLEMLDNIVRDWLETFDFSKLTEEDKKKLTDKNWNLSILKRDEKLYEYCIVKFKDIEEAIDYLISK